MPLKSKKMVLKRNIKDGKPGERMAINEDMKVALLNMSLTVRQLVLCYNTDKCPLF
jgi:hypothetical protein